MDVFALGIALAVTIGAARPADARKTFGYGRIEMLGALTNGTLLLAAVIFIVYEAIGRFAHPALPQAATMSIVAVIALIANVAVGLLLTNDGKHDMNVRAALYHIGGDTVGAVAVIIGGAIIAFTRAAWIDPALSLLVALVIVAGVWRVLADAAEVLLEGVPRGVDARNVARDIRAIEGVVAVHDLHVWTIGGENRALSAHVQIDDRSVSEASSILRAVNERMAAAYGISHATLQLECESCEPGNAVICAPLGGIEATGEGGYE
jgi:cobalt-zinc-cadmium efflux system protein